MKDLLYNINLYKQFMNILYSRAVLKEIVVQMVIQEYYSLTDSRDRPLKNPILVGSNVELKMPLPNNINDDEIDVYVQDHIKVLLNTLLSLNLYGIVKIKKKIYINPNYSDEVESDDYGLVVLKILPDYKKFIITLMIYIISILSVIYYVYWL